MYQKHYVEKNCKITFDLDKKYDLIYFNEVLYTLYYFTFVTAYLNTF